MRMKLKNKKPVNTVYTDTWTDNQYNMPVSRIQPEQQEIKEMGYTQ